MDKPKCVSLAFSGIAVVISVISLCQTKHSNQIARDAQRIVSEEISRNKTPRIIIKYFFADSPDLRAKTDTEIIDRLKLVAKLIPTRYWRDKMAQYNHPTREKKYFFVLFINLGPGRVDNFQINKLRWMPRYSKKVPDGLIDIEGNLEVLAPYEFYALLVDKAEYDLSKELKDQDYINFQEIEFWLEYKDDLMRSYKVNQSIMSVGPVGRIFDEMPIG